MLSSSIATTARTPRRMMSRRRRRAKARSFSWMSGSMRLLIICVVCSDCAAVTEINRRNGKDLGRLQHPRSFANDPFEGQKGDYGAKPPPAFVQPCVGNQHV